ncbi:hypothetical protein R5H30_03345 [Sulfitobacter sp. D35]|uniref:hypothetical protein n=1 Tax=Sulfitobacter sp. D35 TaxID=3083252 RepID=UPI00296FD65F|nr:hypothetical protein [Sulfitobacter sp. D35]MDW4497004.1 hypothetical protein [Sulfitobacter sp. D35]
MSAPLPGIGHNQGPTLEVGHRWRTFQWRRAREAAMPKTIPLMIVKMRVARARELGMDYKAYAAIRQATGRDILALLFSSNALHVVRAETPKIPLPRTTALDAVQRARKLALVHRPLTPDVFHAANPVLDGTEAAPLFSDSWTEMRGKLGAFARTERLAGDQVLIIGDTARERDWTVAMQAAGYLDAERYFSPAG